jgi:hypothetical protein
MVKESKLDEEVVKKNPKNGYSETHHHSKRYITNVQNSHLRVARLSRYHTYTQGCSKKCIFGKSKIQTKSNSNYLGIGLDLWQNYKAGPVNTPK